MYLVEKQKLEMSENLSKYFVVPALGQGGMERVMCELANFACSKGHNVTIICLFDRKIEYHLNDAIKVIVPKFTYKKGIVGKIRTFNYLLHTLRTCTPSSVLSFGEIFNSMVVLACILTRVRIFISDRSSPYRKKGFVNDMLRSLVYRHADGFIAQTDVAKDVFRSRGYNKNIITISNPLREIKTYCSNTKPNNVLVTVGRLIASKNHIELIDIFREINRLDWKLYIIGSGPMEETLRRYIDDLSLKEHITLCGSSDDVDAWLSRADIFVYTSLSEGFPNALSEAVAFPLPCIAYDCPAGPSDIIKNNVNGILIPVGDRAAFKKGLLTMMDNLSLRENLKSQGRLNRDLFSIETIGNQYLNFIK
jgi:GalNAc-alpha-(1->4)-GalNAc-alpha-(1->3)-diNAcBac-PP-undecaprenol alpha-1,4-N-acetyl-D-galactosaminyltransferase